MFDCTLFALTNKQVFKKKLLFSFTLIIADLISLSCIDYQSNQINDVSMNSIAFRIHPPNENDNEIDKWKKIRFQW